MADAQKISTCLWFDDNAEEAASFYVSLFDDSSIGDIAYYGDANPGRAGKVMTVPFTLSGRTFLGLNGGPMFRFSEAISMIVYCDSQQEIDRYWEALVADGGETSQCGWLKDRFGLSWQVVPEVLPKLLGTGTAEQNNRLLEVVLQMTKLDVARMQDAWEGA